MTEDRIINQIISVYTGLYLKYKQTGIGNYTFPEGVFVTKKLLDMLKSRLHKHIKDKEKKWIKS